MVTYSGATQDVIKKWLDEIDAVTPVTDGATPTSIRWSVTGDVDDVPSLAGATLQINGNFSSTDPFQQQVSGVSAYRADGTLLFTVTGLQLSMASLLQLAAADDLDDLLKWGAGRKSKYKGSNGNDTFYGGIGDDQIGGGNGNDSLAGGLGNDKLGGQNGDDVLSGDDGDDILDGGNGNDSLTGGIGNDRLSGSNGNDSLAGGDGDDRVSGGNGNDQMTGDAGADQMTGGGGNDLMAGGLGDDLLKGDGGNDDMAGGDGNDRLSGGGGNDTLSGGAGNDELRGEGGNDRLNGGEGQDILHGQGGSDTFVIAHTDAIDTIVGFQSGSDKIEVSMAVFGITAAASLSIGTGSDGKTYLYHDADGVAETAPLALVGIQGGTVNVATDVILIA